MHEYEELLIEVDELFRTMLRRFVKERDKIVIDNQVKLQQTLILKEIYFKGPQKPGQLSETLDITTGGITNLCDKLMLGGYITRLRSDNDRRVVLIHITEKGKQIVEDYKDLKVRERLFQGFTIDELREQHVVYTKLLKNLSSFSSDVQHSINELEKEEVKQ